MANKYTWPHHGAARCRFLQTKNVAFIIEKQGNCMLPLVMYGVMTLYRVIHDYFLGFGRLRALI